MGSAISTARKGLQGDEKEKTVALERLKMLVKMVEEHLKVVEQNILSGQQGDQQIHAGTVIELERYYAVDATEDSEIGEEAGKMLEAFCSLEVLSGVKTILTRGANILFGKKSVGESEYAQMFVYWEHNTLVRLDIYHWKYDFSSSEIMQCVESVYALLAMKRVVDIAKVHSPVLVYSISRAAEAYGKDVEIKELAEKAVKMHKEAKKLKAQLTIAPPGTQQSTTVTSQ